MLRPLFSRAIVPIAAFLALFPFVPNRGELSASVSISRPAKVADLKDRLEKGLRARLPADFQFIERVVDLVNQGQLPEKLVMGTFDYARRKSRRRPFPYFERALRLRAAKIGVTI